MTASSQVSSFTAHTVMGSRLRTMAMAMIRDKSLRFRMFQITPYVMLGSHIKLGEWGKTIIVNLFSIVNTFTMIA